MIGFCYVSRLNERSELNQIFAKPSDAVQIKRIPNGTADMAEGLGLNPADTLWDYDWIHSAESGARWPEEIGSGGQEMAIALLSRGTALGLTLGLYDGYLEHLQRYAGTQQVVETTDHVSQAALFAYPQESILAQLARKAPSGAFNGKTFCSWLPSTDTERNVALLGGKTLITSDQRYKFNSKVRIMSDAGDAGYNVAPFVAVKSWDELERQMAELEKKAKDLNVDPDEMKFWVKFDNLAAGEGVKPFRPATDSFDDLKKWIKDVSKKAGFPEGGFHPLLIDLDIGNLPHVKRVIHNMCVQGMVGAKGVYVAGTTMQRTHDGHYVGGSVPFAGEEADIAEEAQKWALPVLQDAQRQGYRGYAGIDVMMVETMDGEMMGYILEMNGRLNSSTPLLSTAQWVEREAGAQRLSMDYTVDIGPVPDFKTVQKALKPLWYKGAETGHEGLLPVWLNVNRGEVDMVKVVATAHDKRHLEALRRDSQKLLGKLTRS